MSGWELNESAAREFRLLRNKIETRIQSPAVILATSATNHDGASLTAYGLADALSRSGQRTALVTCAVGSGSTPILSAASSLRRRKSDVPGAPSRHPIAGRASYVTIANDRAATLSRNEAVALTDRLRREFEYVVVDAGELAQNAFGLLIASIADGILVSFRTGRKQADLDRSMLDIVQRSGAIVLGVVMTDDAAIADFARRSPLEDPRLHAVVPTSAEPREATYAKAAGSNG
jgi:Mrp family chromosome partitioning ATPase